MNHPALQIAMRYVHIVSAILLVGGVSFMALCFSPAVRLLDEAFRESVVKMVQHRFSKVAWLAAGGLVISGVYNWGMSAATYKAMGPAGNALIGTKALLALIIFAVMWAGGAGMLKHKPARMINIHLAAVVILIAVVLRYLRLDHLAG